jgi:shikimate dehydrogenase
MSIQSLIDNPVALDDHSRFAAIIGAHPSKGARSPKLWNAAFAAHDIDCTMIPLDVSQANLVPLLHQLEHDHRFIGGAIAAPYKELVASYLGIRVDPIAKPIGSINCLFRSDNGEISGTNTDGEGALVSFHSRFGAIGNRHVVLIGPGGAGKAVAAYFSSASTNKKGFTLVGRNIRGFSFAESLGVCYADIKSIAQHLNDAEILINCTSVGGTTSPTESILSDNDVTKLPTNAIVFDIIYNPRPTLLLQRAQLLGLSTFDGLDMNLQQAVLAFSRAVSGTITSASVYTAMAQVE